MCSDIFVSFFYFVACFLTLLKPFLWQVVKPRPLQAASIPGLLGMFHNVCIPESFGSNGDYAILINHVLTT